MRLTLVRHATLLLEVGGKRVLVDPMLGDAGAYSPIENTPNPVRNPLVPLAAVSLDALDAVLVTHVHNDHWDPAAAGRLPKDVPVLVQPASAGRIRGDGFADVRPVEDELEWEGISLARTGGRHGHGAVADALGPVSGFVLRAAGEPVLWIAGDTVWCAEAEDAIERHRPDVAVVNAGAARFLDSDPITMDGADVARVAEQVPRVVAVHMEAINHCLETRAELRAAVLSVLTPADGETLEL
ncbi:MAG: MBL fold metallo-hydrolase [Actinobacteria bacterium]|nr:MBL fold metallo-hydrolase [Actinomycetota bacterium]